jgi:hypothetical protein
VSMPNCIYKILGRKAKFNVGDDQRTATAAQQPFAAGCLRRSTCSTAT